jgi:hypothetical protein
MKAMVAFLLGGVIGALFMAWFYAHGGNLAVGGKTWGPRYDVLANCVSNQRAAPKVVLDVSVTPPGSAVQSSNSNIESASADNPTRQEEPLSIFNERSRNPDPSRASSSGPLMRTAGADVGPSSYTANPPQIYTMVGTPADLSNMFVVMWPKCF